MGPTLDFNCNMFTFSGHQSMQAPFSFNDPVNGPPFSHSQTSSQVGTGRGHDASTMHGMRTPSCSGSNMPLDEIQLYPPCGFQGQPDSYRQRSTFSGFSNESPADSPIGLHAAMQQILAEVQSINSKVQGQEEMISMLKESNDRLTERFDIMEKDLLNVKQAEATKKGKSTKEGLNDHAVLKVSQRVIASRDVVMIALSSPLSTPCFVTSAVLNAPCQSPSVFEH